MLVLHHGAGVSGPPLCTGHGETRCAVILGLYYTSPQMESLAPWRAIKPKKKKKKKKGPDPISKTVTAFLGEKSFYEAKRRKFGAGGWSQRQNRDQKR